MNKLPLCTRPLLTALLSALILGHVLATHAQTTTVQSADFIVAVVNSEPVTNNEVQVMRNRMLRELNAQGRPIPPAPQLTQQALDLLISEKAQLQRAKEQGVKIEDDQIDQAEASVAANNRLTREDFRQRLQQQGLTLAAFHEQLRNQLTITRLREREVDSRIRITDQEVDQFIQAQTRNAPPGPPELNIAMILVTVPENSTPAAVSALQDKAQDIARRARTGENFAQLAKSHSEAFDKGAKGGEMGLRPADRYPELFVEAVRSLPVQGVAGPVRSDAGFHILKLLERRQTSAGMTVVQTRARHILLRPTAQVSREQAVTRLQEVRQQIQTGRTSFARAAQEMSQDASAAQGGDLGWVNPGQFVPEFEQVMNQLQPGQISDPLVSRFGVHIVEVTDRRRVAVPEKEQRDIARVTLREKRLDEEYERWLEDVRGRAYVEMRDSPTVMPIAPQDRTATGQRRP
ncbi:MAG: peptidylprolyl isomerase [Limnohabitans sp.]